MREGLTPEEDWELRRLHFLNRFGAIADSLKARYTELRARDRRASVREPEALPKNDIVIRRAG
jgi:hypothetical protein